MGELPNGNIHMLDVNRIFPLHKASLHLTHNQHKAYYETVEKYLSPFDWEEDWVSEEQKKKALETQELWELHWYPTTPIGSYHIMGADLEVVLEEGKRVEKENGTPIDQDT